MDFSELFVFIGILRESLKIISKTRKTIAIIAAIFILTRSLIFVVTTFSTKQMIKNLFGQETILLRLVASVSTPAFPALLAETKRDAMFILAVEWINILISIIITLFSVGSLIIVSATAYSGVSLSYQNLFSKMASSFRKQLVTSFYITMFSFGCFFCFIVMLMFPPLLLLGLDLGHPDRFKAFLYVTLGIGLIIVMYLSIVWQLAMVITIVEDNCFGMEALGKASMLIKGNKLQGFAINFFLMLLAGIIQVLTGSRNKISVSKAVTIGIFMICFNFIMLVLQFVSYTILHYQCKKNHGEEVELQGYWGYSKVALVTQDFP